MKTILTFLMSLITVVTGIFSFTFYTDANYYLSALFTIAAHLSASMVVYLLIYNKKVAASH